MTECHSTQNKKQCNCSYPCSRKGICCECLSYHHDRDELPACFFPEAVERTYDRSKENFIRVYQGKNR
jgi:hypothetical protein